MDNYFFDLSKSLESEIEIPIPSGKSLFPFQKVPCQHLFERRFRNPNLLISDPMGSGKTIEAIAILNFFNAEDVLIICPASMKGTWKAALKEWLVNKVNIQIESYNKAGKIKKKKWDFLILDECHYVKNPKAKRTEHILGKDGLYKYAKHTVALSGTPVANRPIELFTLLKALAPECINHMNFFQYGKTFCNAYQGRWGWDFSGANKKTLAGLGVKLRSNFMVRRLKDQILPFLPKKQVRQILLTQSNKAKNLFKAIDKFVTIKGGEVKLSGHVSTERKEIGELKVPKAIEHIKDQLENKDKIVVFAHHISVLDKLQEGLKEYGLVRLDGATDEKNRNDAVNSFQNNPDIKIFLGSLTAAGIGITLTAADYMVVVEASWVPAENQQATDRIHRIGQKNNVLIDFILFEDSIDKLIINAHISKNKNINALMN